MKTSEMTTAICTTMGFGTRYQPLPPKNTRVAEPRWLQKLAPGLLDTTPQPGTRMRTAAAQ
ncbi:MAG: hypothetical protein HUU55_06430 [Myxococcales bacterium]|nr:hypothetical protein [Myxococcales bacterium]